MRSKIRSLHPPKPDKQTMTLGRAWLWSLIGVCSGGFGLWLGEMSNKARVAAEVRAESELRAVGFELTMPTIGMCIAAVLLCASVMLTMTVLIFYANLSINKTKDRQADEGGKERLDEFLTLRGEVLSPVELVPNRKYRYVNPTCLKSNIPSAKWPVLMMVALCWGLAAVIPFIGPEVKDGWMYAVLLAVLSTLMVLIIWPQERRLGLLREGIGDRFRVDANGQLVIIRDGQSYPVELLQPRRPRLWETAVLNVGMWWEEYRSGDKVFVVDRRYWIVDEQR